MSGEVAKTACVTFHFTRPQYCLGDGGGYVREAAVNRSRPYGGDDWIRRSCATQGLSHERADLGMLSGEAH